MEARLTDGRDQGGIEGNGPGLPRGRAVAAGMAVAVLVAIGVSLLIGRAAGFTRVRGEIAEADATWFGVCLLAEAVAFAAYALVVRHALRRPAGAEVEYGLALHVTLASLGATRIVAAAGAGGLAVTYWCFRKAGHSTPESVVRVLGLNTLVYLVFGVGATAAALACTFGLLGDAPLGLTLPWLVVVPACWVAARFVTDAKRVRRLTAPAGSVLRRAFAYGVAGAAWVRDVLASRDAARPLAAAAGYWVGDVVCLWAALHSVGEPLPVAELVLAYATGYAAMMLPLPLGGVGGIEAAMTYALTAVGVPLAAALVAVAVYRLFGFWLPTVPALAALAFLPRAGRALEQAAAAEAV